MLLNDKMKSPFIHPRSNFVKGCSLKPICRITAYTPVLRTLAEFATSSLCWINNPQSPQMIIEAFNNRLNRSRNNSLLFHTTSVVARLSGVLSMAGHRFIVLPHFPHDPPVERCAPLGFLYTSVENKSQELF